MGPPGVAAWLQHERRMLKVFSIPLSWAELFKRTLKEFSQDNCFGLAAQLAYYLLLALVPAMVFLLALLSYFPPSMLQQIVTSISRFAPTEIMEIIRDQMSNIARGQNGGLLTFGLAMALWSSSAAIVAITDALNRAYDIEEGRPWWKVRLTAIALTVGLAVLILISFSLIVAGPTVAEHLASRFGLGAAFEWTWKILQWPLAFFLVSTAVGLVYYFAPDAEQDWTWITPGAVVGTLLWVAASLLFKVYAAN